MAVGFRGEKKTRIRLSLTQFQIILPAGAELGKNGSSNDLCQTKQCSGWIAEIT